MILAKLTNVHNIPDEIFQVLQPRPRKHPNDIYATELNQTPLAYFLKKKYGDEIYEDVSDLLFALLGSSVHYVLDKGANKNSLTEERLVVPVLGYNLVMRPDNWHNKVLSEWKVTRAFAFLFGEKKDWAMQLNVYAWGLLQYGFETDRLVVNAILRDWDRRKGKYDRQYPAIPFVSVDYPLWAPDVTEGLIRGKLLQFAAVDNGKDTEKCDDEYRWHRPDLYAVKKKGTKRALPGGAKFKTREEAEAFAARKEGPKMKCEIEFRAGVDARCAEFCPVRSVCPYNSYRGGEEVEGSKLDE